MSTATMRAGRGRDADERKGSTALFWAIVVAVLALIGFLVAWLGGWIRFTTDPRVAEILALQQEARATYTANGGPANLADATAAVVAMNSIREKVDALPAHLRPQVEGSGGSMMRDMFRGRIDAYFNAPPAARQAELDRQIAQEEIMRQAFEAGSSLTGAGRNGGAGSGQSGGGGSGGQTGGGGGGRPRAGAEEDRNRWRKKMIDNTTPLERARYTEYRRAMEERREQRGLPSGGPR